MAHEPDILPELMARLGAACPSLVTLEEAWFMDPLREQFAEQMPGAFVYLSEDGADGDIQTTCPRQRVSLVYGVWLVCERGQFATVRREVREALFGWSPDEHHEPMQYRGGKKNDDIANHIWWREFWVSDTTYRSSAPAV